MAKWTKKLNWKFEWELYLDESYEITLRGSGVTEHRADLILSALNREEPPLDGLKELILRQKQNDPSDSFAEGYDTAIDDVIILIEGHQKCQAQQT